MGGPTPRVAAREGRLLLLALIGILAAAARVSAGEMTKEAGSEQKKVEWTRVESTPIRRPGSQRPEAGAARIEVGRIVRSMDGVRLLRFNAEGKTVSEAPKTGDKVYVGDQFEVGKAAAVEMTFGANARLRVGENSIMRVVNRVVEADGAVVSTQRDMELEKGSARVRVKKNVRTPSPILVIAGSMVMTLERSDAVLKRDKTGSTVMVLNGAADVILKDPGKASWSSSSMIRLRKKEKIVVPEQIEDALPSKESMKEEELKQAKEQLRFSVEKKREELPPAPTLDGEIDAP